MKRLFANNPHLKVLSFTLTVMLYFFVLAEKETSQEFTLSVEVGDVPAGFVVLNDPPDVTVTVSATARAFARFANRDEDALRQLVIDVSDPTVDRREIREADLDLPRTFQVQAITPRWVRLEIDALERRVVQIRPVIRGVPAPGYEASEPQLTPPRVEIEAPSSYFPELDSVFTESVDITGAQDTVRAVVAATVRRPFVTVLGETNVAIEVPVATLVATKVIPRVPIRVTGPASARCAIDATSLTLTVRGPQVLVDATDVSDLIATIDCGAFTAQGPGFYVETPEVQNLSRGVEIVERDPAVVQLTVTPEPPTPAPGQAPSEGSGSQ